LFPCFTPTILTPFLLSQQHLHTHIPCLPSPVSQFHWRQWPDTDQASQPRPPTLRCTPPSIIADPLAILPPARNTTRALFSRIALFFFKQWSGPSQPQFRLLPALATSSTAVTLPPPSPLPLSWLIEAIEWEGEKSKSHYLQFSIVLG